MADPLSELLTAHGLRRTSAARLVLGWLLAHPDTSYTHAQLQAALQGDCAAALDHLFTYIFKAQLPCSSSCSSFP
jgi:Fur family ferric uptake transcriptional regulator